MIKPMTKGKEFSMGSHLPVLHAVLETFQPTGIMELGAGIKSTPLLYDYGKKLISIESDKEWIDVVKTKTGNREDFNLVHHNIGHGVHKKTRYPGITPEVAKECISFYNKFIEDDLDFLFVDNVSGLRTHAMLHLYKNFKVIAFHDAQHVGYHYDVFFAKRGRVPKNYIHARFESFNVHTGLLIHSSHEQLFVAFDNALKKFASEYCRGFGKEYNHRLRRI